MRQSPPLSREVTARLRSESKYTVSLGFRFTFADIVISGLIYRRGGFVVHQYRLMSGPGSNIFQRIFECGLELVTKNLTGMTCFEMTL